MNKKLNFKVLFRIIILLEFLLIIFLLFKLYGSYQSYNTPITILVSFDGFRWDYLDKTNTPNFDKLINSGVKAESLIPVFPSRTAPNHYTIVTGLYPENHGIIANGMYDEEHDSWFITKKEDQPLTEGFWFEGEPIWSTVEKSGKTSAIMFWIGSEAEIAGYRPSYWFKYNHTFSNNARVKQVLSWTNFSKKERPNFIGVYFSFIDSIGHAYGPESIEIITAIQEADRLVGELIQGLNEQKMYEKINLIIVSDHGMVELSPDKLIMLDEIIDTTQLIIPNLSPFLDILIDSEEEIDYVYTILKNAHDNLSIYKKNEIPSEYHYSKHERISPIIGIADLGWSIVKDEHLEKYDFVNDGNHGYDPINKDMHGIFIATGPSFKKGLKINSIENIHIYNLLTKIMNIMPSPNDGNFSKIDFILKNE